MASTSSSVAMVEGRRDRDVNALGAAAAAAAGVQRRRSRGRGDPGARACVLCAVVVSLVAYRLTLRLLPTVEAKALKRNMYGYDLNKRGAPLGGRRACRRAGAWRSGARTRWRSSCSKRVNG